MLDFLNILGSNQTFGLKNKPNLIDLKNTADNFEHLKCPNSNSNNV